MNNGPLDNQRRARPASEASAAAAWFASEPFEAGFKPSKLESYFNFSYSALAALKTGTSGSASFHIAKKS
jgi:hypothetical protein